MLKFGKCISLTRVMRGSSEENEKIPALRNSCGGKRTARATCQYTLDNSEHDFQNRPAQSHTCLSGSPSCPQTGGKWKTGECFLSLSTCCHLKQIPLKASWCPPRVVASMGTLISGVWAIQSYQSGVNFRRGKPIEEEKGKATRKESIYVISFVHSVKMICLGRCRRSPRNPEILGHSRGQLVKWPSQGMLPQPGLLLFFFFLVVLHITATENCQLTHLGQFFWGCLSYLTA